MSPFTVYPAIDLRAGKVVRLVQGDPARQTVYDDNPAKIARQWLAAGASWLHVVNLDGAFGHQDTDNLQALNSVLAAVAGRGHVQFGGGLRSLDDIERVLSLEAGRVILGTAAIESPDMVAKRVGPPKGANGGLHQHRPGRRWKWGRCGSKPTPGRGNRLVRDCRRWGGVAGRCAACEGGRVERGHHRPSALRRADQP